MKTVGALFCILFVGNLAAGQCRLLLIPREAIMKAGAGISFDLFVINERTKPETIQVLESWSAICSLRDLANRTAGRSLVFGGFIDHPAPEHMLMPHSVERRRITMKIDPKPGDLAEVHVTAGPKPKLQSNTVILYCPKGH
ncbi:MAG: hypothetical protein QOH39_1815 [Verrucomicrobiota bacterium]|jgi:hypothetical protein